MDVPGGKDAFPDIESTPGVCGGEPCIVRTRIPVWVLEQARLHVSEEELLRTYPALRAEHLHAVMPDYAGITACTVDADFVG